MNPTRPHPASPTPADALSVATGQSALGGFLAAFSAHGLVALFLGDDADELLRNLHARFPAATLHAADAEHDAVVAAIAAFIDHPQAQPDFPVDVRGTPFQQRVWQALLAIPVGQTASYTDIAQHIGSPRSVRAVAGACAANNLAVVIPCHRVVRHDGALSGYAWGVDRKRTLLRHEQQTHAGA